MIIEFKEDELDLIKRYIEQLNTVKKELGILREKQTSIFGGLTSDFEKDAVNTVLNGESYRIMLINLGNIFYEKLHDNKEIQNETTL